MVGLLERTRDIVFRYNLREPIGFEYVSPSVSAITGYAPEELRADPQLAWKIVHPDDRLRFEHGGPESAEGKLIVRWLHRDGRTVWTEQHNVIVRDERGAPVALEGVVRDVTEREEALARLHESEQRYRSLIVTMAEGVVMHDAEGRIVMCNPAAERILGLTFDQMRGLTAVDPRWQAIHEDGTPFAANQHPSVVTRLTGRPVRNEVMGVRRSDGSLIWTLVSTEPLVRALGEPPFGVVISFADITALREANEKLKEAMAVMRKLSGLLPICAHCKKIRNDQGYWEQIERYIRDHSEATFSHGICPECERLHFPGFSREE